VIFDKILGKKLEKVREPRKTEASGENLKFIFAKKRKNEK